MKEPEQPVKDRLEEMPILDEIKNSYLNYAMSVIVSRALPDVRDGLKPSQRRILVAMNDLNLGPAQHPPQVRQDRRRHRRQLPPPRRPGHLRHARPHGPGVGHAVPAGRSAGQLRQHRRRPARRHAIHRGQDGGAGHGDDGRPRLRHGRFRAELRRARGTSRRCCRRGSRTCWSTARPASRSAWRRTSRRTTWARSATRCCW